MAAEQQEQNHREIDVDAKNEEPPGARSDEPEDRIEDAGHLAQVQQAEDSEEDG